MKNQSVVHLAALCAGAVSASLGCAQPGAENMLLALLLAGLLGTLGVRAGKLSYPLFGWALLVYVTALGFPKRAVSIGLREVLSVSELARSVVNGLLAFWLFEGVGACSQAVLARTREHVGAECGKEVAE